MQWYDPFEYGKLLSFAGVSAEEVKSAWTFHGGKKEQKDAKEWSDRSEIFSSAVLFIRKINSVSLN